MLEINPKRRITAVEVT